jgi:hypothetical protein
MLVISHLHVASKSTVALAAPKKAGFPLVSPLNG